MTHHGGPDDPGAAARPTSSSSAAGPAALRRRSPPRATARSTDPGRPLRLLRRRHHAGRRREHRLVPARGHGRPRGHRHRVRAARQGDGRHPAGVAVAERGARPGAVQVSSPTTLVREAGVEPLLHCLAVDAAHGRRRRSRASSPRASPAGRRSCAERVIDATGDADIAFRAGAPCRTTPVDEMMGVTVMFSCSGVDKERFLDYVAAQRAHLRGLGHRAGSIETTGKEDDLFSPYLQEPFELARAGGHHPRGRARASAAPGAASPTRERRPTSTWCTCGATTAPTCET